MLYYNTVVFANILASIQQYYNSENICIVYPNDTPDYSAMQFNLTLFYKDIYSLTKVTILTMRADQMDALDTENIMSDRAMLVLIVPNISSINEHIRKVIIQRSLYTTKWIVAVAHENGIQDALKDIYVPFFCEFLVVVPSSSEIENEFEIKEVYQMTEDHPLKIYNFGNWSLEQGLWTNYTIRLYVRRNSLDGITLNVTTMNSYPIVELDNATNPTKLVGGYFGQIWNDLQVTLNFSCRYMVPSDSAWGDINRSGNWSGMIGQIHKGDAMIAVADFLMTAKRMEAVSFTTPLLYTSYRIIVKSDDGRTLHWSGFLLPFRPEVWWCIAFFLLLVPTILILMIKISYHVGYPVYELQRKDYVEIFLDVFKTLCSQGCDAEPLFTPCRIMYAILYAMDVILISSYSAALISFLTVKIHSLPFQSLEEFSKDGTYILGVPNNSAEWTLFMDSSSTVLQEIRDRFIQGPETQPKTNLDGMIRACKNNKYGYFMARAHAKALEPEVPCALEFIKSGMFASVSFTMAKNCPYRGILNHNLQSFRDNGIMERMKKTSWPFKMNKQQAPWQSMSLEGVVPILFFLILVIFASVLILFLEYQVYKFLKNYYSKSK